jgi:AcrR family transcriptional regulator
MSRQPSPGARERILEKAMCLFSEHGIHAVGLQQLIDECGCGKNVLYREFASKDELVVAYLECKGRQSEADIDAAIAKHADDPTAQLVAVVEAAVRTASDSEYHGCAFQTATAEYRDPDHPVNRAAVNHVASVRRRVQRIAATAGAADPKELTDRLMLLIDGVYASATVLGPRGPVRHAVQLAELLVAEATEATEATEAS